MVSNFEGKDLLPGDLLQAPFHQLTKLLIEQARVESDELGLNPGFLPVAKQKSSTQRIGLTTLVVKHQINISGFPGSTG